MPKLKKEYKITLMVLLGVGLLIFGINFLQGRDIFEKRNVFHALYDDVAGITETSPVFYRGLKVGQVVRTELMPDGSGRIAVSFQLSESRVRLTRDTKVMIYSADLFTRALQLLPGNSPVMAVVGDTLLSDAQLSLTDAVSEQIDPLKQRAEGMLASVDSLLTSLQMILNDSARRDIDASFASIRSTLETFNSSAIQIDEMLADNQTAIRRIIDNISVVANALAGQSESMERILVNLDTVTTTLAEGDIKRMLEELNETSAKLKEVMTGIEEGKGTLGNLLHNDTLYNNLEAATRELDLLLEDFRINPNRYVHLSLFGRKDRLPKLSNSDIDRIKRSLEEDKR